jgi:ubiquinol-cytochrome c reductase cytochrome c subunit
MRRRTALLALCALAFAPAAAGAPPSLIDRGRDLFAQSCITCHGPGGEGRTGVGPAGSGDVTALGPPLVGVGAAAAHFYLSTGYMPLRDPYARPTRSKPRYTGAELDALVAYVASLGGPPIPRVDPARGNLSLGRAAYTQYCAGCHQGAAAGGMVTGAIAPKLDEATAVQIAEAIRVGPYVMPRFGPRLIDQHTVDSIARYVLYLREPRDPGGWSLGHLGPVAEGAIAWLLAGTVLVGVARMLGKPRP